MPISALVITLQESIDPLALRGQLAALPGLELGELQERRWPAVAETASLEAGRELVRHLEGLNGVVQVDVLSVHFEDVTSFEAAGGAGRTRRFGG